MHTACQRDLSHWIKEAIINGDLKNVSPSSIAAYEKGWSVNDRGACLENIIEWLRAPKTEFDATLDSTFPSAWVLHLS